MTEASNSVGLLLATALHTQVKTSHCVITLFVERTPCTLQPHPCNNNANCTAHEENESVECQCFEGWEGENCQIGEFN